MLNILKRAETTIHCLDLNPGEMAISGGYIQLLFGVHFGLLSFGLMFSAAKIEGGVGGVSWVFATIVGIIGCVASRVCGQYLADWIDSIEKKLIVSTSIGLLFIVLIPLD